MDGQKDVNFIPREKRNKSGFCCVSHGVLVADRRGILFEELVGDQRRGRSDG